MSPKYQSVGGDAPAAGGEEGLLAGGSLLARSSVSFIIHGDGADEFEQRVRYLLRRRSHYV